MKLTYLQYNSPVILTFFFLSFAVLVLNFLTHGWINRNLCSVYRASLTDPLTYLRFFGHVLGHANLNHFFGNMLLFLVVGPPLEEKYGSLNLLACILITAVLSGLFQFIFAPKTALLGASGIVFMMIMLSSLSGMENGYIPITLILVGIMYLSKELYAALFVHDNTANIMHIFGGICGTLLGFILSGCWI